MFNCGIRKHQLIIHFRTSLIQNPYIYKYFISLTYHKAKPKDPYINAAEKNTYIRNNFIRYGNKARYLFEETYQ